MNRIFVIFFKAIFVISLISVLFQSCESIGDVKVGFLMPAYEGSRWPIDEAYMKRIADEMNVELVVVSADNDENIQLKQSHDLIEMGMDALIVVAVNQNTATAIVREAHNKNIPVIAHDRLIGNSDLDCYVSYKGDEIGNMMLEYALNRKPQGNYVFLWGDAGDANAVFIKEAQEKTIAPYVESGKINITYKTFVEDWSEDNAFHYVQRVLSFSEKPVDAIVTSYDGLARGARKALDEVSYKGDVVLTGQDAELESCRMINSGQQSMTIYKSIESLCESSLGAAVQLAKGQEITGVNEAVNNGRINVPSILLTPVVIDKDKLDYLIEDKLYTHEQLYSIE